MYSVVVTYQGTQVSTMIILEFVVISAFEGCNKTFRTVDAAQSLSHFQPIRLPRTWLVAQTWPLVEDSMCSLRLLPLGSMLAWTITCRGVAHTCTSIFCIWLPLWMIFISKVKKINMLCFRHTKQPRQYKHVVVPQMQPTNWYCFSQQQGSSNLLHL